MVFLKDENNPSFKWTVAPGRDDKVRLVKIQTIIAYLLDLIQEYAHFLLMTI